PEIREPTSEIPYFTKTSLPNRAGLCGPGRSRPESDHRLSLRLGSVPSHRFRLAVQTDPDSGGSFFVSSSKFAHGIATSRLQPWSRSPVWFSVPRMWLASCTPLKLTRFSRNFGKT